VGYTRLPGEKGFPIDELLPVVTSSSGVLQDIGGCANDDICYVVVSGPAIVLTSMANYAADVDAQTPLNTLTAVTSGATSAGRLDSRTLVAATLDASATMRNITEQDGVFGVMMTQALTAATNADRLVDVIAKPAYFL
jgi:hypothetical protein